MKSILTLIACCSITVSAVSQSYNTVTINFNGQNKQVLLDNKEYAATVNYQASNGNSNNNMMVVTNDLAPGRHNLKVVRNNNRKAVDTYFTLRNNYDIAVTVAPNGSVQLKETYRKLTNSTGSVGTPMSTSNFNLVVREVNQNTSTTAKASVLNRTFSNTANYYTTNQAKRLIQMVNGESVRLQLAKAAVRGITDKRNTYTLTSLLAARASRTDFTNYVEDYNEGTVNSGTPGSYPMAMPESNFASLVNEVRNSFQPGAKMRLLSNTFSTTGNYFSTAQAIQLIQFISTEQERLQLAKASYHTIIDKANFNQVHNLLGTQASRDELSYFVASGGTGTYTQPTSYKTPMADASFNSLVDQISVQWLPGAKKRAVIDAFTNTTNYFTTQQAARLVQLDADEDDRIEMAKASIRSLTDMQNINTLYNIFTTQAFRDELAAYVRTYTNTYGTTN